MVYTGMLVSSSQNRAADRIGKLFCPRTGALQSVFAAAEVPGKATGTACMIIHTHIIFFSIRLLCENKKLISL